MLKASLWPWLLVWLDLKKCSFFLHSFLSSPLHQGTLYQELESLEGMYLDCMAENWSTIHSKNWLSPSFSRPRRAASLRKEEMKVFVSSLTCLMESQLALDQMKITYGILVSSFKMSTRLIQWWSEIPGIMFIAFNSDTGGAEQVENKASALMFSCCCWCQSAYCIVLSCYIQVWVSSCPSSCLWHWNLQQLWPWTLGYYLKFCCVAGLHS